MEIFVRPDGSVNHILVDGFSTAFLGERTVTRASFVEPVNPKLRYLFHLIRRFVPDNSFIAAWTRRWRCQWQANLHLSGGPIFGPFRYRKDALAAEVFWINQQYAHGSKC